MIFIYLLRDPRDNQIRYVGKTDDPQTRYNNHLNEKSRCARVQWIRELRSLGLQPTLDIVEELADDDIWEDREILWIRHYRDMGCNLTNGTDGGEQGPDCTGKHLVKSESALKNIIAALTRRNKSPEMREVSRRNGLQNKGRKESSERVEQKRKWMTGRKLHTDEFKQKLAQRNKSKVYTNDDRAKARANAQSLWDDPIKAEEMRKRLIERNKANAWRKKK